MYRKPAEYNYNIKVKLLMIKNSFRSPRMQNFDFVLVYLINIFENLQNR